MADLIHEAHKAIHEIESSEHRHTSPSEQIAIAHVKVLLSIAQLLDERLPRPDPPGTYRP
ncbi:hypothetical protein [Mycolicibacterium vanbaalenii]|uniref:hypothetical protein n=1 Tax=Mycolicibacterium vanbaalenii TaxID=110539 RepID=UPI0002E52FF5|nr:hypothetical protein [Mycolicibacterium vanbaalenii]MCV7127008.1 hypothetical protein [Mycolicibacterium vanbaalenii PYR-1]